MTQNNVENFSHFHQISLIKENVTECGNTDCIEEDPQIRVHILPWDRKVSKGRVLSLKTEDFFS